MCIRDSDLARIITTLREKLPLAPDCEITIEGRVLNFDAERIDACLDAGANRFSIGIQSFNSKIRKKMARTSDGPTAIAFMESLVKRDHAAVSYTHLPAKMWLIACGKRPHVGDGTTATSFLISARVSRIFAP